MKQVVEYTKGERQGRSFWICLDKAGKLSNSRNQTLLLLSGGSSFGPWQMARRQL